MSTHAYRFFPLCAHEHFVRRVFLTSLSCAASRPDVLYTKVDAQCDKLATDDRHQFITLSVHLT